MRRDRIKSVERADPARVRARDLAVRRSRVVIGSVAAGAVVASGVLSAVAAQAFKGHARKATTTAAPTRHQAPQTPARRVHVPGPQAIPGVGAAPLQPPAAPPAATAAPPAAAAAPTAAAPAPAAPAPTAAPPQVSGGS